MPPLSYNPAPSPNSVSPSSPPKSHLPPNGGTLTSLTLRLRSRALQGLSVWRSSCSGLLRSGPVRGAGAGRRRSWVLSPAPGGRSMPPTQPRVGARAPGGLRAGRGSADLPQVAGSDPRGTAGAPALCAPAPAAQLLTMTSSHLPSRPAHPRGFGGGGEGAASGSPPGQLGDVVPAPIKVAAWTEGVIPAGTRGDKTEAEWDGVQLGLGSWALEGNVYGERLRSLHQEAGARGPIL